MIVKNVYLEDLGGGLVDYLPNGFRGRLARFDPPSEEFEVSYYNRISR